MFKFYIVFCSSLSPPSFHSLHLPVPPPSTAATQVFLSTQRCSPDNFCSPSFQTISPRRFPLLPLPSFLLPQMSRPCLLPFPIPPQQFVPPLFLHSKRNTFLAPPQAFPSLPLPPPSPPHTNIATILGRNSLSGLMY